MDPEKVGRQLVAWMRTVVQADDAVARAERLAVEAWPRGGRRAVSFRAQDGLLEVVDFFTSEVLISEPARINLADQQSALLDEAWWTTSMIADPRINPCAETYAVAEAEAEMYAACDNAPFEWLQGLEPLEHVDEWRAFLDGRGNAADRPEH